MQNTKNKVSKAALVFLCTLNVSAMDENGREDSYVPLSAIKAGDLNALSRAHKTMGAPYPVSPSLSGEVAEEDRHSEKGSVAPSLRSLRTVGGTKIIEQAAARIKQYQEVADKKTTQLKELKGRYKELETERDQLQADLRTSNQSIDALAQALEEAQAAPGKGLQQKEIELAQLTAKLSELEASKTAQEREKTQTTATLQQKESDLVRITATLSELKESKSALEREKTQTSARLQEKEVELARIQGRMEAMDQLAAAEKENLANKTSLIAGLQAQLQQVEAKAQAQILQVKRAAVDDQILALGQFLQLATFGVNIQQELGNPDLDRERFLGGLTATISPLIFERLKNQAFLEALLKNKAKITAYSMTNSTASETFVKAQTPICQAALKPALAFTFTKQGDIEHGVAIAQNLATVFQAAALSYGNHLINCCSQDAAEAAQLEQYTQAVSTALQDLLASCKP